MMTASEFALALAQGCGVAPGSHVLAAVSGGADSVALLCLLEEAKASLGVKVSCAHVEHGIRGEASQEDMRFVHELCMKMQIPLYVRQVDVPGVMRAKGMGLEEAARMLRHQALQDMAQEAGADVIALAHHALDQAETVLMHAARGSDVQGICAMRHRNGMLVRPLLGESPEALRAYLTAKGQSWREDDTNQDIAYARSRVRYEVLPALERAYPGAMQALCRLAQAAQRDELHFDRLLAAHPIGEMQLVDGVLLDRRALSALDEALRGRCIARALSSYGFGMQEARVVQRISLAAASEEETVVNMTCGAHAYVAGPYVCLIREQAPPEDIPIALEGETKTPFGTFFVRPALAGETGDGVTCQAIDEELLRDAVVSCRQAGMQWFPSAANRRSNSKNS